MGYHRCKEPLVESEARGVSPLSLLEPARIRFVSGSIVVLSLILLVLSFASAARGGATLFGPGLGADYAGFYTAGYILDHDPPARLYDRAYQDQVHHELHPHLRQEETLPFVHPPFVAWAFRPLSRLPYAWSFAVWLVLSLGMYLGGIWLLLSTQYSVLSTQYSVRNASDRLTIFLLALSFEPFVMECWLGGQLSAFGFLCLAAFLALDRSGRQLPAGLVLGLCLYKPTLLVILLPVLLAARRFWTLLGVTLTGLGLLLLTWATVGTEGIRAFLEAGARFSRNIQSGDLILPLRKFVDLNSCTQLLLGLSWPQRLLVLALILPPLGLLLWRAWHLKPQDEESRLTVFAVALLATPVLNFYVGIYDSILAVLGVLILAGLQLRHRPALSPRFQLWLLALYVAPWVTQPLARLPGLHLQVYTFVLYGLTVLLLKQCGPGEEYPVNCGIPETLVIDKEHPSD